MLKETTKSGVWLLSAGRSRIRWGSFGRELSGHLGGEDEATPTPMAGARRSKRLGDGGLLKTKQKARC